MTRPIRIAFSVQPQHADYAAIRTAVADAEEAGADVVTCWDHFFPLFGEPEGKHFECWTMLAAWAEATSRVELASLVTPPAYRNPGLLADMARTVDHISDGRLILGLGAGWFEKDYQDYGFEFGTAGSRLAQLESAIPRIQQRWANLNPPPTRDIPILIGGGGEQKTLRYTARHANIWHGIGELDDLIRKQGILDRWCETEGRDPATIERSTVAGLPTTGSTPSGPVDPAVLGPKLAEAGFTLLNVRAQGPAYDLAPLRAWLSWRDEYNAR